MKTKQQIKNKIAALKNKLVKTSIRENFGDKEQRVLEEFVGDIYSYDYNIRLEVNALVMGFMNWCYDYTGETDGVR